MKKALITGISGFAGSHLAEHLASLDFTVYGWVHPDHRATNIDFLKGKIVVDKCNIQDRDSLFSNVKSQDFNYVFHLAASSAPSDSFKNPKETLENNILGELNLLESLAKIKSSAKILIVGSADEYGNVKEKDHPISESTPFAPISPYAVSKIAQDMLGLQFHLHEGLNIVRVRPFNHIGPRQSPNFVVAAFAKRIAAAEKKGEGTIKVGNLDTWRDFTDVRDIARAYLLALERGKVGEVYNIGSGRAYKIGGILEKMLALSTAKIKIRRTRNLVRNQDIQKIICDFSKFKKDTGWFPKIPLSRTLFDTMEYERNKLAGPAPR